ncbi:GHKL domain-containing protein, partial [Candidatus Bathyarchaeota archaeon]|nr:GHKL domain-containing protein [Candidatus Bathyarchaeota archaeon]
DYIWFEIKGKTFTDHDGETKALLISRDISQRKKLQEKLLSINEKLEEKVQERTSELKETQERLIRQEKLAALGKLSGSVSHDLRNPLNVINSSIFFLKMKLADASEKIKKHLGIIENEVHAAKRIIEDLLDSARIEKPAFTKINANDIIKESLQAIEIPPGIKLKKTLCPSPCIAMADKVQMRRVLVNLIINAIDAMGESGTLEVHCRLVDAKRVVESNKKTIAIDISDTGHGIGDEVLPHIFEPLYTTKKKGLGLGLPIVQEIVERHGGEIKVFTNQQGTKFTVLIPSK